MTATYQAKAHVWNIPLLFPDKSVRLNLKTFIDDVNLLIGQPAGMSETEFYKWAQHDINRSHDILHDTGGEHNMKRASGWILCYNKCQR